MLFLGAALAFAAGCGGPPRPDVVLVVIDTLRADRLPFYGAEKDTAPFLTGLAHRSTVFERAWSTSSWTAPATASIFTSTHPNRHGVILGMRVYERWKAANDAIRLNRIPDRLETIPSFLRSRGYATFGVSGNPNVSARLGFDRGFDRFALLEYPADGDGRKLLSTLLQWRREIDEADPVFLYLHFMDPHEPYHRHEQWIPESERRPKRRDGRAAYDSEIRLVDEQLRGLFESLPLGDAVVIVTADHGEEFGEHGGTGHGFKLYSELTRVPLLVHVPEGRVGRVSADVSILDVLPTLRELLGEPASDQDAGRSLLAGADRQDAADRAFYAMRTRSRPAGPVERRAVVHGSLKLIVTEPGGVTELYDLVSDPSEQRNLAPVRPVEVGRLRALLDAQRGERDPAAWVAAEPLPIDRDLREQLEGLGYLVEDEPPRAAQ